METHGSFQARPQGLSSSFGNEVGVLWGYLRHFRPAQILTISLSEIKLFRNYLEIEIFWIFTYRNMITYVNHRLTFNQTKTQT